MQLQQDPECQQARLFAALRADTAPVGLHGGLRDGQADAGSVLRRVRFIPAVKTVKKPLCIGKRARGAGTGYQNFFFSSVAAQGQCDPTAGSGIFYGIIQQDRDSLLDGSTLACHHQVIFDIQNTGFSSGRGQGDKGFGCLPDGIG